MLAEGSVGCHLTNTEQSEVKIKRPSVNQTYRWGNCFLLLLFGLTAARYPVFSVLGVFMWVFKCLFLLFLLLTLCGITALFFWIFRFFFPHIFLKSKMLGLDFQVAVFLSLFSKIAWFLNFKMVHFYLHLHWFLCFPPLDFVHTAQHCSA